MRLLLSVGPDGATVSQLSIRLGTNKGNVAHHLAVLERAGLLTKRREGRQQLATGDVEAVRSVTSMLAELEDIWRGRIDRIDALLEET